MSNSRNNIGDYFFNRVEENFKPLILDGAMGSYLQEKGNKPDDVLWMSKLNQTNPDLIIQIHREYLASGANIITTNTFRTNPAAFECTGDEWKLNVQEAVELAKTATNGFKNVFIAGSNPPAEDCYQMQRTISNKKLELNHKHHIDLLIDTSVDFILNETQSHLDEIRIITKHCYRNKIPYILSLYITDSMEILSGEPVEKVIKEIQVYEPLAIGYNCISPALFKKIIEQVSFVFNWGFYLNCGTGKPTDQIIKCGVSPEEYLGLVKESMKYKPSFIGSCCGSNPNHIKMIKEFLDGRN